MSTTTTIKELQNMNDADLQKEIRSQENTVVKLRLGVKLGNEKDSAKYKREKKQLARMKTVLSDRKFAPAEKEEKNAEKGSQKAKKSVSSRSSK